uniref:C-type lectin domain-containing protein n=1 Tax=Sander lucioperca TaxID=283035 RepID=A0A8C9YQQ0_SANLU
MELFPLFNVFPCFLFPFSSFLDIVILSLSSIAAVSSLLSGQCSSVGGQLYEYHFIGKNMTWKAAKEYCRKHHTDLATVSNQADMQRLHNPAKFQAGAWIGLQRDWRWSQPGVEFNESESKWYPGEPNNLGNHENCVGMRNDKWNDISCSYIYEFICYEGENMWCIESVLP